jgi:hypothetical protein
MIQQAKDAALAAKSYLAEVVGPDLPGLMLDEVEKVDNTWVVGVSYYESYLSTIKLRKILTIDAESGDVISMKNKNGQ